MRNDVDMAALFRIWHGPLENAEAAAAMGVSRYQFYALGRRHGLGRRTHIQAAKARINHGDEEITEEEFEARRAEVQSRWSDEERERRRVGPSARPWRMPSYAYDGRVCAFAETTLD